MSVCEKYKLKERFKDSGLTALSAGLLAFMGFVFGPAELFFANVTDFTFLYQDFAGVFLLGMIGAVAVCTLLAMVLPPRLRSIFTSLLFGGAVAGYCQVMFWNRGLDQLGELPDGYAVQLPGAVFNLLFWVLVLGIVFVLLWRKPEWWKRVVQYGAAFLLLVQGAALVSLYVTADEDAFRYPDEQWVFSGKDQLTVSSQRNVILFVLDHLGSGPLEGCLEAYPDAIDCLHDFVYYPQDVCNYYGTYPSLQHMLTGCDVDMSLTTNEQLAYAWGNENVRQLYEDLRSEYEVNIYTQEMEVLAGTLEPTDLMGGLVSNLVTTTETRSVNHRVLYSCMLKSVCYRYVPEFLKPYFYIQMVEYTGIVDMGADTCLYHNWEFNEALCSQGLTLDDGNSRFIVMHLCGAHEYDTGVDGNYEWGETNSDHTVRGCMQVMENYLDRLRELGVYDNTAIVITADHGMLNEASVPLFVKDFNMQNDTSPVLQASISHCDLLPTLAELAGADGSRVGSGRSVFSYAEDEERELWFWERVTEDTGDVYRKFLYQGEIYVEDPALESVPRLE